MHAPNRRPGHQVPVVADPMHGQAHQQATHDTQAKIRRNHSSHQGHLFSQHHSRTPHDSVRPKILQGQLAHQASQPHPRSFRAGYHSRISSGVRLQFRHCPACGCKLDTLKFCSTLAVLPNLIVQHTDDVTMHPGMRHGKEACKRHRYSQAVLSMLIVCWPLHNWLMCS